VFITADRPRMVKIRFLTVHLQIMAISRFKVAEMTFIGHSRSSETGEYLIRQRTYDFGVVTIVTIHLSSAISEKQQLIGIGQISHNFYIPPYLRLPLGVTSFKFRKRD